MARGARLTGRGWAMVVIGLVATAGAAIAGERDLIWVTAVPVFLPLLSLAHLTLDPPRITHRRTVEPATVAIGESARVVVEIHSASTTQAAALRFTDHAPAALGDGARFGIARGFGSWRQDVGYTIATTQRGRYEIGPLAAEATDALALARIRVAAEGPATSLRVTPHLWRLGSLTASPRLGAADATPQRIGQAGSDDVLVREHRHGDDLRRVHWKMTARQGDLMVRLEEHPWDPSSTLVVDTRTGAHFGQGPGSSLEWAVSAVTSVAAQLTEGRHRLTIVSPAGLACDPGHTLGEAALQLVLEAMTDLTSSEETWLGAAVADPQLLGASATIVAATGRLTAHDAAALAAAGTRALSRVALAPDIEAWGGEPGEHADALRLLRNHGWTVELYGPRTGVAEAWRRATT